MAVTTSAATKLFIGGTGDLGTESSWVEVGEITDIGEFGRAYQTITHNPLGERRTKKIKGSYNEGTFSLSFGRDLSNAGQTGLRTASNADESYNFKIELNDTPSGGTSPTTYTFKALVMSFTTQIGGVNDYVRGTAQMEMTDVDITETAAA